MTNPEVSIPNAMRDLSCGIERYISTFIPATRELNGFSEDGIARKVLVGIALALISAASAIEAAAAGETAQTGSTEGESAAREAGDAQGESVLLRLAELERRAREVEGDSDNPLRVAAANKLWDEAAALRASVKEQNNGG